VARRSAAQNGRFDPLTDVFVGLGRLQRRGHLVLRSALFGQTALNALPAPVLGT